MAARPAATSRSEHGTLKELRCRRRFLPTREEAGALRDLRVSSIGGLGARSHAAARQSYSHGASWALGFPLQDPRGACWAWLGSAAATACKKKTGGVGRSFVSSCRALIGHRGSLLPRCFDTSESRGVSVDVAVDCPIEAPAWLMGLYGFLGDLSCGMPRAL